MSEFTPDTQGWRPLSTQTLVNMGQVVVGAATVLFGPLMASADQPPAPAGTVLECTAFEPRHVAPGDTLTGLVARHTQYPDDPNQVFEHPSTTADVAAAIPGTSIPEGGKVHVYVVANRNTHGRQLTADTNVYVPTVCTAVEQSS